MARILSLETSTSVCSVAVHEDGKIASLLEVHEDQSHASRLAVLIEQVQQLLHLEIKDLDAIAVSSGPGSYTGLRIGVSTAKGLCFASGLPLISVNSLLAIVHRVRDHHEDALICPMIDARRMEVYCLLADNHQNIIQTTEAKVIDENSFAGYLGSRKILFVGNGAAKCASVIRHENAMFLTNIYPSAGDLGILAFEKFRSSDFEHLAEFEPFYLKDFLIKKPAGPHL